MKKAKARRPTKVRLSPKLWPTSGLMAPMTLVMREMTKKVSITSATMPIERREAGGVEAEGVRSFMSGPAFRVLLAALLRFPALELGEVDRLREVAKQPLAEIIGPVPEPVVDHVAVAVALAREDEEVEALAGLDQGRRQAQRVGRVDVVVDVAGRDQ